MLVEQVVDLGGLELFDFFGVEVGEDFVDDFGEDWLFVWYGYCQLVVVWCFVVDFQVVEFELVEVLYVGGEVVDEGVGLVGGQCLQGCCY